MLFLGHLLLGIFVFLLLVLFDVVGFGFSLFSLIWSWLVILFFVLVGAMLPDIDEKNSKINRWSGPVGRIVIYLFSHRGVLHSLFLWTVLSVVVWRFVGNGAEIALFFGYLAHITGDGITPMGVKIFLPFSEFKIKGPIRVGSVWEKFLWGVLVLVNLILLWKVLI